MSTIGNQTGLHGCWTSCLEHSAGGHNKISVTFNFLSAPQNLAFQKIIPSHHHLF